MLIVQLRTMVIPILSYKPGTSLHIPPPINIVNLHYHSLLGDNSSSLVSNPSPARGGATELAEVQSIVYRCDE